ncbi:MAG: hypothetical protein CMP23_09735 [Rickettsiales bacterium]|nr:hypothetical protein [Rickettsiales bacterium]|tara:strand:+ start:1229 stop:2284 length:1056 start_codon:yes stop_codon:yes gene_type:complete
MSSLYESRLLADLNAIEARVQGVAEMVRLGLDNAVLGLLDGDSARCYQVVLYDKPINRETRALDAMCHAFVATHFPAAGHLRFISSVLRLDIELERTGDYGVNIAREAVKLSEPPPADVAADIKLLAAQSLGMFERAIGCWADRNAEQAKALMATAYDIEKTYSRVFKNLLQEGSSRPLKDLFALLDVCKNLERVGGQSKNICEETVFTVTGETKEPKVYRILFADAGNDSLSQLAEAFARKVFSNSGEFSSAGWSCAEQLDDEMVQLANSAGLDLGGAVPRSLAQERERLKRYHLIVGLGRGARQHIPKVPFNTIYLEWDVEEGELAGQFREVSAQIRALMEILRGERAC